jgi:phenylacetate-CoA ligase
LESYGFYWLPKERINFLSNRFRLPVFDLSNPVLENFLAISGQKNLIILTATLAQLFCSLNFTRQKHCFKDVCPTLKACVVTSEMLLKRQKTSREQLGIQLSTSTARQN